MTPMIIFFIPNTEAKEKKKKKKVHDPYTLI